MKSRNSGFTLIELLIVIAIIGIVATMVVTSVGGARKNAKEARFLSQIKSFRQALELYNIDSGRYPVSYNHTSSISWVRICGPDRVDDTDSDLETLLDEFVPIDDIDGGDTGYCMQYRGWGSDGSAYADYYYETACGLTNPWPYNNPEKGRGYLLLYTTDKKIIENDHFGTWDGLHWHCTHHNK